MPSPPPRTVPGVSVLLSTFLTWQAVLRPEEMELARLFADYWTSFAKDGKPSAPAGSGPAWPAFDAAVREKVGAALVETFGDNQSLSCRFTHVYPDGPAPYYTWFGMGTQGSEISQWQIIKDAANDAVVSAGGTSTHHHAVGRMHRPGAYDVQRPELFAESIRAVKKRLDPNGILNPGVLIDP